MKKRLASALLQDSVGRIGLKNKLWLFPLFALTSLAAQSQEREWWFEIEVILFKRDINVNQLSEGFESRLPALTRVVDNDLISPFLQPDLSWTRDSLPYCFKPSLPPLELEYTGFSVDPLLSDQQIPISELTVTEHQVDNTRGSPNDLTLRTTEIEYTLMRKEAQQENSQLRPISNYSKAEKSPLENYQEERKFKDEEHLLADYKDTFVPFNTSVPSKISCVFENEQLQFDDLFSDDKSVKPTLFAVPSQINGVEWRYSDSPYLMSRESLQLKELARDIGRQKDLSSLLHLGWRQEVLFGKNKAQSFRLIAGKNYASEYSAAGLRLPPEVSELDQSAELLEGELTQNSDEPDLLSSIEAALSDPDYVIQNSNLSLDDESEELVHIAELWQLDGQIKVFLRYIQGVPYLHIDSELDFRSPKTNRSMSGNSDADGLNSASSMTDDSLQSYRFSQLRRVISKQIHYFDHPLFGMVVQIRRFDRQKRPDPEATVDSNQESGS